jgi:hypothetical protein
MIEICVVFMDAVTLVGVIHIAERIVYRYRFDFSHTAEVAKVTHE